VLSGLSHQELAQAVATQDTARLVKVPGVGKKTAERLLLELKDKLTAPAGTPTAFAASGVHHTDISQALMALGYAERDALAAIKKLPPDIGVSEGIKQALQALS
jgi:holliday junction DNA helicase RuvA